VNKTDKHTHAHTHTHTDRQTRANDQPTGRISASNKSIQSIYLANCATTKINVNKTM